MKNSQLITVLTIFILVFSVSTIALTLEGSHTVFAAKKSKSESKTTMDGPISTPSSGQAGRSSGDGGSNGIINPLSLPCPDGSIPVKGKCPLSSTIPQEDSENSKLTTPSTSESSNTDGAGSNTLPPLTPATSDTNAGGSKHKGSNTDSSSSMVIPPLSVLCPDGSIPLKGKCPTLPAALSDGTSGTKNKDKSDKTTTEASSPQSTTSSSTDSGSSDLAVKSSLSLPCPDGSIPMKGECSPPSIISSHNSVENKHASDKNPETTPTPPPTVVDESSSTTSSSNSKQDTTDGSSKSDGTSSDGSSSSSTSPPPVTTSDSSNTDGSKGSGTDSSNNNTPLPSIIPSNQGASGTDTGNTADGSTDSTNSDGSTKPSSTTSGSTNGGSSGSGSSTSTDTGSGSSSNNGGGSTKPSSTTSGSGSSSGGSASSTSSSTSSSSNTNTKPANLKKTPQTSVSQSAAIAATNQIINSPGSTIVNQQSIKQSVKINNEINNIIRKNVISQSSSSSTTSTAISNLITVKLAPNTMSKNAYLPIGDVAPYHLIGGHVTANLPNNHLYVVVAQLASNNGAIEHAVVLDMIKSQISNTHETDLGSQISGTNPLTGKQDVVSDITNLFLWNNGNQQITFSDANAVTMNLIYK